MITFKHINPNCARRLMEERQIQSGGGAGSPVADFTPAEPREPMKEPPKRVPAMHVTKKK